MSIYFAHVDVELPAWVGQWMEPLSWGLGGALALWLLVTVYRWPVARAYNLTKAESASVDKSSRPDFLTVDQEARDAAIARGDSYVRPADREAAPPAAPTAEPGMWVRIGPSLVSERWWPRCSTSLSACGARLAAGEGVMR